MFNGLDMNLGNLSRLSSAKSRSISPENFMGEKRTAYMDDSHRAMEKYDSGRNKRTRTVCRNVYGMGSAQ